MQELFPIVDTKELILKYGISSKEIKNYMAISADKIDLPKKGEWFISGSIPGVYYAHNDLNTVYLIARIVKVKKVEYYEIEEFITEGGKNNAKSENI